MKKLLILAFVMLSCTAKTEPVIITDDDGNIIIIRSKGDEIIVTKPDDCTSFLVDYKRLTTCHGVVYTPLIDK